MRTILQAAMLLGTSRSTAMSCSVALMQFQQHEHMFDSVSSVVAIRLVFISAFSFTDG